MTRRRRDDAKRKEVNITEGRGRNISSWGVMTSGSKRKDINSNRKKGRNERGVGWLARGRSGDAREGS